MNKISFSLVLFAIVLFLGMGCKKSENPTPEASCKVAMIAGKSDSTIIEYTNSKLSKISYSWNKNIVTLISYSADKVKVTTINGIDTTNSIYHLASNGRASSLTSIISYSGSIYSYDTTWFSYDQEGYLVKELHHEINYHIGMPVLGIDSTLYTISKGNIISRKRIFPARTDTTTYEYYKDLKNKTQFTIYSKLDRLELPVNAKPDFYNGITGKQSIGLIKKASDIEIGYSVTYIMNWIEMDTLSKGLRKN
jgi:hypothetical protein